MKESEGNVFGQGAWGGDLLYTRHLKIEDTIIWNIVIIIWSLLRWHVKGSGSGSGWVRIHCPSWIRIRIHRYQIRVKTCSWSCPKDKFFRPKLWARFHKKNILKSKHKIKKTDKLIFGKRFIYLEYSAAFACRRPPLLPCCFNFWNNINNSKWRSI